MNIQQLVVVIVTVSAIVFGLLGTWVAKQCGRRTDEGFLLGMVFGPLGVLLVALLPRR